jgi:uridine phosphorylase
METEVFPVATWLVEEKGADVTVLDGEEATASQLAFTTGKMRLHDYLIEQERRQAARKAEKEKRQAAWKAKEKKNQDKEKAALFKAIAAKAAREKK